MWKLLPPWAWALIVVGVLGAGGLWLKNFHDDAYRAGVADEAQACKDRAHEQEVEINKVKVQTEVQIDILEKALRSLREANEGGRERVRTASAADPNRAGKCLPADVMREIGSIR